MAQTKNLCAQIPLDLHTKVCEGREESGLTTAQYITNLLTEYYETKKNGGNTIMANNNSRTMAFQIPEDLFQRIKAHLERETARTGKKVKRGVGPRVFQRDRLPTKHSNTTPPMADPGMVIGGVFRFQPTGTAMALSQTSSSFRGWNIRSSSGVAARIWPGFPQSGHWQGFAVVSIS